MSPLLRSISSSSCKVTDMEEKPAAVRRRRSRWSAREFFALKEAPRRNRQDEWRHLRCGRRIHETWGLDESRSAPESERLAANPFREEGQFRGAPAALDRHTTACDCCGRRRYPPRAR